MMVGIVGAGAWGTALGVASARGGCDVVLWSFDGVVAQFDGVTLPDKLTMTRDMADLEKCDVWLVATPAAFFAQTLHNARAHYRAQPIIICTKGADSATGQFMSEIIKSELPECAHFGVLSGPQFAAEVAAAVPTGSTIAGDTVVQMAAATALREFYLTPSDDIIGTELCGVGKNAVALICGYLSVASRGENERALIYTRAWGDVVSIGCAMGARLETFLGLCGMGDLYLTATSPTSRNFSGGVAIANGATPTGTTEGISALGGLIRRGRDLNVDVPTLCDMARRMGLAE